MAVVVGAAATRVELQRSGIGQHLMCAARGLAPTTRRGFEAHRRAVALERARHRDVLHQWQVGKATDLMEQLVAHEQRLVAGGDAGPA
jgi:hypothetical protein